MSFIKNNLFRTASANDIDIQPSLQQAVDAGSDGDVIRIPAGKFVVNKTVNVNKAISFEGAGLNKTFLYRSESVPDSSIEDVSMFNFNINNRLSSNLVVRDICFKSKKPSLVPTDGLSTANDKGISITKCVDFVIARCRFENFGNSAISVLHYDDLARGLISKNEFYHNYKGPGLDLGYAVAVFGENKQWVPKPLFGSDNFVFIEDNIFDTQRHAVTAGGCGLYVARNNYVPTNLLAQAFDAHEARGVAGLNYYSTRAYEIYNNGIFNTTFKDGTPIIPGQNAQNLANNAILVRGGEGLVYGNEIKGYRFGCGIENFEVKGPQLYPIPYQIGCESGMNLGAGHTGIDDASAEGDLFVWGNNFTPYVDAAHASQAFYNFRPEYFKEDRDYHLVAKPNYVPYIYPHPNAL